jgi:hypothetical protein
LWFPLRDIGIREQATRSLINRLGVAGCYTVRHSPIGQRIQAEQSIGVLAVHADMVDVARRAVLARRAASPAGFR